MNRIMQSALWLLVLPVGLSRPAQLPAADRPPNVILIVSDDQGYNDLGCLDPEVKTPNLDRIAREGARLTSFYVAWPACTPSRGALLTGRYPQRNGIYDMIRNEAPDYGYKYPPAEYEVTFERIGGMDEREVLLPKMLHDAGYRSAIFGKWDLGGLRRYLPIQRGFDEFYGFVNTGIDYFTHERYGVPSMYSGNAPTTQDKETYCTYLFEREALRFVRENKDRPFFLYLPFNAPHGASNLNWRAAQAPPEFKRLYPQLADTMEESTHKGQTQQLPSKSKRRLEYLGAISCMDAAIGKVLALLDEYQIADNTLVLFHSDNGGSGGSSNAPLRGNKGQMFEGGVRVCAVARFPERIPAGSVCEEFLTTLEVIPTVLKLAGVAAPQGVVLDGYDMLPALAGQAKSPRSRMFWQRQDHSAVRVGDWKWVRNPDGTFLFNLADDLGEKTNLMDKEPAKAKAMEEAFAGWRAEMDAAEPRGPFRDY